MSKPTLAAAKQGPQHAGVGFASFVVDQAESLRKLPVCPAPAMLLGESDDRRKPAQAAFPGGAGFQHAKFVDDDGTRETLLPRHRRSKPFADAILVGRSGNCPIQEFQCPRLVFVEQLLPKVLALGGVGANGVWQPPA